ncbi:MAG: Chaperone protein ClpB [Firmicutes bacterium ADurb.Bin419]|nr:MAG: Chaperone protein ClpB [Firmicutes bacterium ADurb.Bin419]
MAEAAYTPVYGARPVKRYLQKFVETEIGKMIIKGLLSERMEVKIDFDGEKLTIQVE